MKIERPKRDVTSKHIWATPSLLPVPRRLARKLGKILHRDFKFLAILHSRISYCIFLMSFGPTQCDGTERWPFRFQRVYNYTAEKKYYVNTGRRFRNATFLGDIPLIISTKQKLSNPQERSVFIHGLKNLQPMTKQHET